MSVRFWRCLKKFKGAYSEKNISKNTRYQFIAFVKGIITQENM